MFDVFELIILLDKFINVKEILIHCISIKLKIIWKNINTDMAFYLNEGTTKDTNVTHSWKFMLKANQKSSFFCVLSFYVN